MLNEEGRISGRAQSAVRPISPTDFNRIVEIGLAEEALALPRVDAVTIPGVYGVMDEQTPFIFEVDRERASLLSSRIIRDRVFRQNVLRAYDSRCALTGLKLINGDGRVEAEAAHIRPVEQNGPDIVNNGLALSGTAHWMFDRGWISLNDDLKILISRQVNDFASVRALINADGYARPPQPELSRPHPHFLAWHRSNCFKG